MRFDQIIALLAAAGALAAAPRGASAQILPAPAQPRAEAATPDVRLFDRRQIIVKFAAEADPAAVMSAAIAGDREAFRPGGGVGFTAQASGATLVDLGPVLVEPEQTGALFGVERIGAAEAAGPLDGLLLRLNADPRVVYAQKNYLMRPFDTADLINQIITGDRPLPNDPYLAFQWHLKRNEPTISATGAPGAVNFPDAWAEYQAKRRIVVAVVDTGQLFGHDDVNAALLLPGYDFVSHPYVGNDGDGRDSDPTDAGDGTEADACFAGSRASESSWHGSHVSGIAGLAATDNEVGIASPVRSGLAVVPVRALGRCGGTTADLVDAVLWAAGLDVPGAPANRNPAQVINASFGGPSDGCGPAFQDALAQVRAKGAVLVAAAGNESADSAGFSPAACADAFTVAASDIQGTLAPYSNFGSSVDLLAPGGDVSKDLDGDGYADGILSIVNGGYSFYNGTSMAAPLVSAAVALALAHNPGWAVPDALDRLRATAMPRDRAQCGEPCGAGLMNAAALLD